MTHLLKTACVAVVLAALSGPASAQTSSAYFEFLMARRLEAQEDLPGALAALERAAMADPSSAEIRAEIAAFSLRRNRPSDAERAAREALALDDDNLHAHRVLGLLYAARVEAMNARTPADQIRTAAGDAIRHLERASRDVAAGLEISFSLGRLYLRTGDTAKAVAAFTRVVNQNPDSLQGRLALAQAYAAADDLKNAVSTLEMIVAEEPRVASALAQYQEQAGLHGAAVENYTRALTLEPTNRALKVRRIVALIAAREFGRAAALAAEAQKQHADDLRFPRLRASALFDAGQREQALQVLEPAAKAFPNDATTQLALADLYSRVGRGTDAERTLRQTLERQPDNAQVLNHLGYLLAEQGRQLDEAIRLVQRALDLEPDNPYYLDSLGWAHFQRGDLEAAEKYLSPAAAKLPDNPEVQDHFGDLLARRGRWADAVEAWRRALQGDSGGIDRTVIEKKISDARSRLAR